MRDHPKILLAAIGLISVLVIAVPVSSQDGYYGPVIIAPDDAVPNVTAPNVAVPTVVVEEQVELLPPVELIAPVGPYHSMPAHSIAAQPRRIDPIPSQPLLIEPIPAQTTPAQPLPAQPLPVQPLPAQSLPPQSVRPADNKAFENMQTPQADMIIGLEVLDPVLSEEGTCDTAKKKLPKIWSGNVEFGLDGTEGNSQTFNVHIGFSTKRKTECSIFTADLDYNKKNSDSINTADRLFSESRLERPHCSTPWTWYVHGSLDYDEFQPWNVQVNGDTGIGYQIIASDATDLTSRFGGGASQEIGGPDDAYVPELLFGLEFEHRRGDRHKFKIALEYFPDVTDFSEFRMVNKASWEVLLDKKLNLSLSFNVIETINRPNPGGKQADLDYSAVLLWNF